MKWVELEGLTCGIAFALCRLKLTKYIPCIIDLFFTTESIRVNIGAIIGGTIGGVVVLIIVIVIVVVLGTID